MNCPACHAALAMKTTESGTFQFCSACKGIWFDKDSLRKFDDQNAPIPVEIDTPPGSSPAADYSKGARKCPQCPDSLMCRRWYDVHRKVEVDQCLTCSGIFLDGGELSAIRSQYPSEKERLKAEDIWLGDHLKQVEDEMEADIAIERAKVAANKRTLQYRLFKAVSDWLGTDAF